MHRRTFLARTSLALAATAPGTRAWSQPRPFRVLLNSNISGPQAFFFLAQDRGYMKAGRPRRHLRRRRRRRGDRAAHRRRGLRLRLRRPERAGAARGPQREGRADRRVGGLQHHAAHDRGGCQRPGADAEGSGRPRRGRPSDRCRARGVPGIRRRLRHRRAAGHRAPVAGEHAIARRRHAGRQERRRLRFRQHDHRVGGAGRHRRPDAAAIPRVSPPHTGSLRQHTDGVAAPAGRASG